MTSINKASYPILFGPTNAGTDNIYAILAGDGIISTVNTTTVNIGTYGTSGTTPNTGSFNGTGTENNVDGSTGQTQLTALVNAIQAINSSSIEKVDYAGNNGTFTFDPNKVYTNINNPSAAIVPNGPLVFNAYGNSNAQFYIIGTSGITFGNATFSLINGAQAGNIYWVSNAQITFTLTTGVTTEIDGVFIAQSNVTFSNTNATPYVVNGNVFAQTDSITFGGAGGPATINASISCYLKGTFILTENGYIAIENIKVGDRVVTKGKIHKNAYINTKDKISLEPVVWIGGFKAPNLNSDSLPICIKANALGENQPFEDLYVSPRHQILLKGKMVLPKDLINGTTIYQDWSRTSVEYYHLELESHYAIVANGILSESYLDGDNLRVVFKKNNQSLVVPNAQPILA